MKIIIIGGVAGGASAAARLRRLNENAHIILLERGRYVSYANCGLPYYIGGEIQEKSALTVQTPESLHTRLNLDVRTRQQATGINTKAKEVTIHNLATGTTYTESYDKLILSPGAEPIKPPIEGLDNERVFTLRNIPDTFAMDTFIKEKQPKHALVVGGGYIGLEMAENLTKAGLQVTMAEMVDHIVGPLDVEMAREVEQYMRQQGITLLLENGVKAIQPTPGGLHVQLANGSVDVDMVLLSIGVKPDTTLAAEAGLELGARGAILVDEYLQTSAPDVYAVGDAIQITQLVSGQPGYIPLAGPANKQGRIAADNICGAREKYRGTQGTAVLKLFNMVVGATGLNEQALAGTGLQYDKVYLIPSSHAGYYPGATPISMKVLFEKPSGRILGAQLVGFDGVDKRLDVLATAIRHNLTAYDLTELELGYAPPFSSAKDPVNMAGFMIENILQGKVAQYHWADVAGLLEKGTVFVDVRTPAEYAMGHLENAINIPVDELRQRLGQLDKTKPVYIYCRSGQRSYLASRILQQNGFEVKHMAGGYLLYTTAVAHCSMLLEAGCCS